ncbi:eukaryotic translation initiation factor 4E member 2 [Apostichopus japonicus]|uniref:Eukaryotic translation initiation factor 4E member 2 n=1 Tax=Stichopus japonicus TaxID=307972 RepID=A0A2G8KKY1_STIJA|nr:eukaryotic translation initiation factor 4E member 2 [Apostichopus japonicus]
MSTITEVSQSEPDEKEQIETPKINDKEEEEEDGGPKFEWPDVKVGPGEHALQFPYSLWFSRRSPGNKTSSANYEQNIKIVGSFASDSANKKGGKWIVRLRKGLASRLWENLILAMLGEQFMVGDEICGAVVSIRFAEDIISIWNRTSSEHFITNRIRDTLRRVLNLPPNTIMEYKTHTDSMK